MFQHQFFMIISFIIWEIVFSTLYPVYANPLKTKSFSASSGIKYLLIEKGDNNINITAKRPSKKNKQIQLCIPAAFTTVDHRIDGVFVYDGVIVSNASLNKRLGGALQIVKGKCRILATDQGELLRKDYLDFIAKRHGSLLQQFQLVTAGKPARFRDKSKFQRRAIVIKADGNILMAESYKAISLTDFSKDLVELGSHNAIYTDMGLWDEGWFRRPDGKIITIGLDRSYTSKQTNWLIFYSSED